MKLSDIKVEEVLAGDCWVLEAAAEGDGNPAVRKADEFSATDVALMSAIVRLADGTDVPSLVVKSFVQGGDDIDIYIHSKFGWMNIHTPGFMRAIGKYSHDIFPFDYFLARPWKGGRQPQPDGASPHAKIFRETAVRIRGKFQGVPPDPA